METMERFNGHEKAQCYVRSFGDDNKWLVSYHTIVAEIQNGWLIINGLYSRTTIKHIGWFMKSLGFDYQTAKTLYEKGLAMNIHTGEVK